MREIVSPEAGAVVDGVSHRFGSTLALDNVELRIQPGVLGLLGPNGAGKTTLMRILATVLPIDEGQAFGSCLNISDGQQAVEVRRRLGYLPQVFGYYGAFTAAEFIEYVAWLKVMPPSEASEAVTWALEHVGMTDRAKVKMRKLSGGMRRRVAIALATPAGSGPDRSPDLSAYVSADMRSQPSFSVQM